MFMLKVVVGDKTVLNDWSGLGLPMMPAIAKAIVFVNRTIPHSPFASVNEDRTHYPASLTISMKPNSFEEVQCAYNGLLTSIAFAEWDDSTMDGYDEFVASLFQICKKTSPIALKT